MDQHDHTAGNRLIASVKHGSVPGSATDPDHVIEALYRASAHCGLLPAATTVDEFHRRLADLVELTAEDATWFISDSETDQIVMDVLTPVEMRVALLGKEGLGKSSMARLVEEWDRHVETNVTQDAVPAVLENQVLMSGIPSSLAGMFDRYRILAVDSLGTGIAGALFTGPVLDTLIVARSAHIDQLDQTFALYHMVMHILFGHVRRDAYDFRLEFPRGDDPRNMRMIEGYINEEQDADDAASCMLSSAYADNAFLHDFAANARHKGTISKSVIRDALHNRHKLMFALARRLQHVTPLAFHGLVDPPTSYTGTIGIATAPNHPLYLLQRVDHDGESLVYRRWIPSRKVLRALGAENLPTDVVIMERHEIDTYPDGPMLISPLEVAAARRYLLDTAARSAVGRVEPWERLAGLDDRERPAAEGLWPDVRYAMPLPTLTALSDTR